MQLEAPPSRPALWPLLVAYLAAFVLVLVASAVFIVVPAIAHVGLKDPAQLADEATRFALSFPGLLGAALVSGVVLTAVALSTARLQGRDLSAQLAAGPTRARPLGVVALALGTAGLSLACGTAADLAGLGKGGVTESIALALHSSSPLRILLAVLAIGVAPAFAEELFFRGLIQTRLRRRWRPWSAIVVTALAFGVFHLDPVQGSQAFVVGLFFGWAAVRFGGIRPTIAAHALNNTVFVVIASLGSAESQAGRAATAGLLAAGVVVCGLAVATLRSRHAVRDSLDAGR